jgi:KDO2-lipid IV(A) lauroyltransferase
MIGALLGWFVGSVLRIRRAHVGEAMRRAGIDPALAAAFYRSLGRSVVEMLWHRNDVRIEPESLRRFHAALEKKRGVVIAASHTGNFELAAWHAASIAPLLAITKTQSVRLVARILRRLRDAHGMRTHGPSGAMRAAREHLGTGGAVAMIIDQVPDRASQSVRMPFLGEVAHVDRSPAVLAARARCPLVVTASRRLDGGTQSIVVLDVIEPQPTKRGIEDATRRATRALESFVLAHPTEWLWMHRRWKRLVTSAS